MKCRWILVPGLLVLLAVSVTARPGTPAQLSREIDEVLHEDELERAFFGAKVVSLQNGEVLYARNPSSFFMPASNMKLVTAIAAAEILGLDYHFQTLLATNGRITKGTLDGDLIVIGSGDPTIGARLTSTDLEKIEDGDPLSILGRWAERLRRQGIRRVTGDLVADPTVFAGPELGPGWAWDDFAWGYCAPISGLQFNENTALLRVPARAGPVSAPAVELIPPGALRLVNLLTYAEGQDQPEIDATVVGPEIVELKGKARSDRDSLYSLAVPAPPQYFLGMLKEVLLQSGIVIEGTTRVREAGEQTRLPLETLFTYDSPDLRYVLKVMLKISQNLYADTLLKVLSPYRSGKTFEDGKDQVGQFLEAIGVPDDGFVLVDGSGLSRYNLLTPETLVMLLEHAYREPYGPDLVECLPIGGVDGTLRRRMDSSAAAGNARAKTGTLAYVRCLSGYVKTRDGEMLAFSLMLNHAPRQLVQRPERLLDEVVGLLAEYSRAR
jgi:D-alanyl-D-alanine carboxypeptidase/D-alanyl-D-alanine-endopeptidase (penicillin-binding protein 4)